MSGRVDTGHLAEGHERLEAADATCRWRRVNSKSGSNRKTGD